ncbi:MAG TPA: hypothetical protein VIC87_11330 [Vicinamibacteria bacterium]|jgi:hypothetical protein
MRSIRWAAVLVFSLLFASAAAEAATLRVVVVQPSDTAAYLKAVEQGKALFKSKGNPAVIRVWRARYAGQEAGAVVVSVEYASLEALAKEESRFQSDPDLRAWVQSLDKLRKVVSDSIYEEMN